MRYDKIGFPTTTRIKTLLASPQQKTPWPVFQDGRCNTSPFHAHTTMSPLILSQKLHSLRATSGYHYLVSGTISPPDRGTFQLSLTVLLRYRSWEVFRIRSYCLPHSDPISNGPYSRKIKNRKAKKNSTLPFPKKIMQKKTLIIKSTGLSPSTVKHHSRWNSTQQQKASIKNARLIHHISPIHVTMQGFGLFYVVFARRY